jgi:hypothetical protein
MEHIHDIDCLDFFQLDFGGWLAICEITEERFIIQPVQAANE